jgi:hypothetical protein
MPAAIKGDSMAALPYVTAPGSIERALQGIKSAATPQRVNQDFVKTILKIPGGSGNQIASYLRKIGFTNEDGTPSDIYKKFRNPVTSGRAAAEALRLGYGPLYVRNEYMHKLSDENLRGLIIEETGQEKDSNVVALILTCIKAIRKFADWSEVAGDEKEERPPAQIVQVERGAAPTRRPGGIGLNLSYTINLNLPATPDVAVFNAIFKSLKENLLEDSDES